MISDASAWWLGDWLVYGENRFPDRYKSAIEETILSYKTLRNYAWVARRFSASRRRDTLSLHHHAEVAALPLADQESWLDRTEQNRWSVIELRRSLQSYRNRVSGSRQPEIAGPAAIPGESAADAAGPAAAGNGDPVTTAASDNGPEQVVIEIAVAPGHWQLWKVAAERNGADLTGWISSILNREAQTVLHREVRELRQHAIAAGRFQDH
jgi:hypothetical protein